MISRNGRVVTSTYPELQGLHAAMHGSEAILDGEIVALDAAGTAELRSPAGADERDEGRGARQAGARISGRVRGFRPALPGRREVARGSVLEEAGTAAITRTVRDQLARTALFEKDGAELLRTSREQGLEGVVCKRLESPYLPGRRSGDWLKIKHERAQEVVIGGWRPGPGAARAASARSSSVSMTDRNLVYAGTGRDGLQRGSARRPAGTVDVTRAPGVALRRGRAARRSP